MGPRAAQCVTGTLAENSVDCPAAARSEYLCFKKGDPVWSNPRARAGTLREAVSESVGVGAG